MRYLVFREYATGFNNRLMSLELAVGLAHWTGRTLVFHGGEEGCYAPKEIRRHEHAAVPAMLDLMDPIPVPHIGLSEFRQLQEREGLAVRANDVPLYDAVFSNRSTAEADEDLVDFAEGRQVLRDVEEPVWEFDDGNLGFYSRFFHRPDHGLLAALSEVRPRAPYRELAERVVASLGEFDGVHVRLTDFRSAHPRFRLSLRRMRANLRASLPRDRLLVVCTDEPDNRDLLDSLFRDFPDRLLVDAYILDRFGADFAALPFRDHVTLGLLCNLVMAGAHDFVGTAGSTYTGLIHREWFRRRLSTGGLRDSLPFRFLESGLRWPSSPRGLVGVLLGRAPRRIFRDGSYLDAENGRYSWNRTLMPLGSGPKSWWREWPECVSASNERSS